MPPSLTGIRVYGIARCVAAKYHLPMPNLARVQQNFRCSFPLPITLENDTGTLWVDRYYIAYQLNEDYAVRYVYLTKHHIREEVISYRNAVRNRHLLEGIAHWFQMALHAMSAPVRVVWVDRKEVPIADERRLQSAHRGSQALSQ